MQLLAVYVGLLTVGEFGAYAVGRQIDAVAPAWSLTVFLAIFFFMFWATWRIAIRIA